MKRAALLSLVLLSFWLTSTAHATSGACSYHGGVDCNAGADSDGSVVCNDGWRDSSVMYSFTQECSSNTLCKTQDDLSRINAIIVSRGLSGSTDAATLTNQCEQEIQDYQQSQQGSSDYASPYSQSELENLIMEKAKADAEREYQAQIHSYNLRCQALTDGNSTYDINSNGCKCDEGYSFLNGSCVSEIDQSLQKILTNQEELRLKNSTCQDALGLANYNPITEKCECAEGATLLGDKCVILTPISTSSSSKVPSDSKPSAPISAPVENPKAITTPPEKTEASSSKTSIEQKGLLFVSDATSTNEQSKKPVAVPEVRASIVTVILHFFRSFFHF